MVKGRKMIQNYFQIISELRQLKSSQASSGLLEFLVPVFAAFGPGGDSHMEQTGMLVGNFEFNPLRRPSGRGSSFL